MKGKNIYTIAIDLKVDPDFLEYFIDHFLKENIYFKSLVSFLNFIKQPKK